MPSTSRRQLTVLFGSPNTAGHTAALLDTFFRFCPEELDASLLCAYDLSVSPCCGCEQCREQPGCVPYPDDDFRKVDALLRESDLLVIATPLYFAGFPAPLKQLFDRFRLYDHHPLSDFPPKKAILLTTAGSDDPEGLRAAEYSLRRILRPIHAELVDTVFLPETDRGSSPDPTRCKEAAEKLFRRS